jgi:hypothetical protein
MRDQRQAARQRRRRDGEVKIGDHLTAAPEQRTETAKFLDAYVGHRLHRSSCQKVMQAGPSQVVTLRRLTVPGTFG